MRLPTKSSSLALAALLFASASLASAGSVNLVANPSFEADVQPGIYSIYYGHAITGWGSDGPIEIDNTTHDVGSHTWNGKAEDGDQMVELASDYPTNILQDIATVAGQAYTVSFYYTSRDTIANGATSTQINASFGGTSITPVSEVTGAFHWDHYSFTAIASGPTTQLLFSELYPTSGSYGVLLDDVSVTAQGATRSSAVPLPASVYGGTALLVGLAAKRLRRGA